MLRANPQIARRKPRLRLWQFLAILWVAGLALPDAWRAVHLAVVPHVVCPYDGALVHEDEVPASARSLSRSEARPTAVIPEHHHHGCAALNWCRHSATVPVLTAATPERDLVASSLTSRSAGQHWSQAVLSYAPKLPPPLPDA